MLIESLGLTNVKQQSAEDWQVFKNASEKGWKGLIESKQFLDPEDGTWRYAFSFLLYNKFDRCEHCAWEIVDGHCVNCGPSQDSDDADSLPDHVDESSEVGTGDDESVEYPSG